MKIFIFLTVIFLSSAIGFAAPGDLDPTFSGDGLLLDGIVDGMGTARAVVVQPDGKILIAGGAQQYPNNGYMALARYNSDGTPDVTFGAGGKVAFLVDDYIEVAALALQADGKIVAVGCSCEYPVANYFTVYRFLPNGLPDPSFGQGYGAIGDYMGDGSNLAVALAVQTDGSIVVAGSLNRQYSVLFRYKSDGSRDSTFGNGGMVVTTVDRMSWTTSIVIQPDGSIIAAGASFNFSNPSSVFTLVRYKANGSLDSTFGLNGIVRTKFANSAAANSVALQADGKIIAAGTNISPFGYEFALSRYNPNGSADLTFGSDGRLTTSIAPYGSVARSVVLECDGKILAAGSPENSYDQIDFHLVRYNANGSLDATFGGGDGIVEADFGQTIDVAYGMALDNSGRAVMAGTSYLYGPYSFRVAIARFVLGPRPGPVESVFGPQ